MYQCTCYIVAYVSNTTKIIAFNTNKDTDGPYFTKRMETKIDTWARVPTSWRRLNNSFPLISYTLFSVSELGLDSVPGSSLRRKAPAYGACLFRLSCKAANNLGSCRRKHLGKRIHWSQVLDNSASYKLNMILSPQLSSRIQSRVWTFFLSYKTTSLL